MADRFLVITKRTVIDTPAQAAVPADPGPPPVAAIPAVAEVSHEEVNQAYIEDSATQVAINLELPVPNMKMYLIKFSGPGLQASLKPVTVKGGARAAGPSREVVEIEADGGVVGSAVVDA